MNKQNLPVLIDEFARAADAEFTLADLTGYLSGKGIQACDDDVCDFAAVSDYLLESGSRMNTFLPRRTFYQGAQFRISPLDGEVEGGYLIPGHRFVPFLSPEVFPGAVQLFLPDGTAVPVRKMALPQKPVMACLHFFGPAGAAEYLLFDDPDNKASLEPPFVGEVSLTVFDLRRFYAFAGFRPGDSLMLTVEDWLQGRFKVTRAEEASSAVEAKKWIASMAWALDEALNEFGADGDCDLQLALATRNAQENPDCVSLMDNPPLSFPAYFNLQKNLAVKLVGERALFWDVDAEPMEEAFWEALDNPAEPESELDAIFQDIGLSLSESEAEAYMRDALFHGSGNADGVLARVSAGRSIFFASAEQQDRFHELWGALWNEMQAGYSRADDRFGEIRSRLLTYNDKAFAAVRQLDAAGMGPEIFQNPAFMEFNEFTAIISAGLALFNSSEQEVGEPSEFMRDELLDQIDTVIEDLTQRLLQGGALSAGGPGCDGPVYQLKISLKGAKPPIWRRILVAADLALEDLHDVIQGAMGWEDIHLFQFSKGRTCYRPDGDETGCPSQDCNGMRICDLLHKEKAKIAYEYDFGDAWEHTVTLEKILEPEEGQSYPVCIKGMRACPPEDCGGLRGYYKLLDILNAPDHEQHDEMLDWIGGSIDPEAFDLEDANGRIRRMFD